MEQQTKLSTAEEKYYEQFADMLIKQIEVFKGDWKKPWQTEGCVSDLAHNADGREYTGTNAFFFMMVCAFKGYSNSVFATFNRWKAFSYREVTVKEKGKTVKKLERRKDENGNDVPEVSVNKGEHGYPALYCFYSVYKRGGLDRIDFDDYVKLTDKEKEEYVTIPRMVVHQVFNIDQTNLKEAMPDVYAKLTGAKPQPKLVTTDGGFSFPEFDNMVETQGWVCPIIQKYQDRAYFAPLIDSITLPLKGQFVSGEAYYSTAFHEMAHSTGVASRLNRDMGGGFGTDSYGREELIAEMTAALVCSRFGIQNGVQEESVAYLDGWLSTIKKNPSFLKTVLADVRKAHDMIVSHVKTIE